MSGDHLSDAERHPLLSDQGRALLKSLSEHPSAPQFNAQCGDRLDQAGLRAVSEFQTQVDLQPPAWRPGGQPAWVAPWLARTLPRVRAWQDWPTEAPLSRLPTMQRADLSNDISAYVPQDLPLESLVVHNTFGTTGDRLVVPWSAEACAMYLPLMRRALALLGVPLEPMPQRVGVLMVCWQHSTVVVASVASYLGESGFLKVNLDPGSWRDRDDARRYLEWTRPYLITGDPLSFSALAELAPQLRPAAMVSSSMHLSPALAAQLSAQFECPVLDLYSCNETGPIAARNAGSDGPWTLLQPQLLVEIVDPRGRALPPGERGDICVTGGFNPYLPLLRYRTGDHAALRWHGDHPQLVDLQGRQPVLFHHQDGRLINNIDLSVALKPFPLARFRLTQRRDLSLLLETDPPIASDELRDAVATVLGALPLQIAALPPGDKVIQYQRKD